MSEQNPWKKLSSKKIYENPWITLVEDTIIKPNGEPGIYGIVESKIATGIIPIFDDLSTILVGQYRYTMNQYSWEIIEGGAENAETPKAAAIRELKEEGGLTATEVEQLGGEIHLSNSHSSERGYLFLAKGLSQGEQEPDDTEILKIKRLPISDTLKLIENGEIQDALSIIGIYRVARHLDII